MNEQEFKENASRYAQSARASAALFAVLAQALDAVHAVDYAQWNAARTALNQFAGSDNNLVTYVSETLASLADVNYSNEESAILAELFDAMCE